MRKRLRMFDIQVQMLGPGIYKQEYFTTSVVLKMGSYLLSEDWVSSKLSLGRK